jgi:hypothetical protein
MSDTVRHAQHAREASSCVDTRILYSASFRSRSALAITDTELKVIAALAIMGLSSSPNTG